MTSGSSGRGGGAPLLSLLLVLCAVLACKATTTTVLGRLKLEVEGGAHWDGELAGPDSNSEDAFDVHILNDNSVSMESKDTGVEEAAKQVQEQDIKKAQQKEADDLVCTHAGSQVDRAKAILKTASRALFKAQALGAYARQHAANAQKMLRGAATLLGAADDSMQKRLDDAKVNPNTAGEDLLVCLRDLRSEVTELGRRGSSLQRSLNHLEIPKFGQRTYSQLLDDVQKTMTRAIDMIAKKELQQGLKELESALGSLRSNFVGAPATVMQRVKAATVQVQEEKGRIQEFLKAHPSPSAAKDGSESGMSLSS